MTTVKGHHRFSLVPRVAITTITIRDFVIFQSGLIELTIMGRAKKPNYLKTWNDNYEITINESFLTSIIETVFFPHRNHHGNFQIFNNVKWQVTHEWEELCFSTNACLY